VTVQHTADHQALRNALVDELRAKGAIRSVGWSHVFRRTPRHVFVPGLFTQETNDAGFAVWRPMDSSSPQWLEQVYTDVTLVTSLDPATAKPTGDGAFTGVATSSSTLPSLMASMLEDLDVEYGMRVLEIGTGTGYNAALLSTRLSDQMVYSVDIDPTLVDDAREALASAGLEPRLRVGDGRDGWPGLVFDRIIATCSVSSLPEAWRQQTRPGGIILADIATGLEGGLVRFTVAEDGTAEGRYAKNGGRFMSARSEAATYPNGRPIQWAEAEGTRPTEVTAAAIRGTYPFRLLLSLLHPKLDLTYYSAPDGTMSLQLQTSDGNWARVPLSGEDTVTWGGDAWLWRQVEDAWTWWNDHGQPAHHTFGLTVGDAGQRAWWQPENGARTPLPETIA
jgi:methyltransferase of ATP-grasp peptide maturase system